MFYSAMWLFSILFALLCIFSVLSFCKFPLLSCQVEKGDKNSPLKMGANGTREPDGRGAAFELAMDHLGP